MENTYSRVDAESLSKAAYDFLRAATVPIVDATGNFDGVSVLFTWQGEDYKVSLNKAS